MFKPYNEYIFIFTALFGGIAIYDNDWKALGFVLAFGFIFIPILSFVLEAMSSMLDVDSGWADWDTLEQYWIKHPECKTKHGNKCFHCGSSHIRQYGFNHSADPRRIHKCNQCNTTLYRS